MVGVEWIELTRGGVRMEGGVAGGGQACGAGWSSRYLHSGD